MNKFNENHAGLEDAKQIMDWEVFSDWQKYIVDLKIGEKLTQRHLI